MTSPASSDADAILRLVWPQWQGAGSTSVRELAPDFAFDVIRRGYEVGTAVLLAVLPAASGPTETVAVPLDASGLASRDGVEAKDAVLAQLDEALGLIAQHDPARILTLGGDCAVSVAPFSALARRYGDDLAVVWIDSHPAVGTPAGEYDGYHAMAVAALTGHGDPDVLQRLPSTVDGSRVALVGLHSWTDDDFPHIADWGLTTFSPDQLRTTSEPLLSWLAATGCTKVALHFDVDTVDATEVQFGLGFDVGGLTSAECRRVVADVTAATDVVGTTIAEFIPRQVIRLQQLLAGFPLIAEA